MPHLVRPKKQEDTTLAEQWHPMQATALLNWLLEEKVDFSVYQPGPMLSIRGWVNVPLGYWVILQADGRWRAMDNDLFLKSYSIVEEDHHRLSGGSGGF